MLALQIDKFLKRNPITKETYMGTYASDMIPMLKWQYPHCFCVNTSDSNEEGEHWTAIFVESPTHVEFFDSFGEWPPRSEGIMNYLNNFIKISFNSIQFQSEKSSTCGKYVIYFLHMRNKNYSFNQIIKNLQKYQTKPDILVSNFYDYLTKNSV